MLLARDKALQKLPKNERTKIYVVLPNMMQACIQFTIDQTLKSPQLVCLIPSHKLNPEENYYN